MKKYLVDVNETLEQLLDIANRIHDGDEREYDAGEMADLIDSLDHCLSNKGFLPERWKRFAKNW